MVPKQTHEVEEGYETESEGIAMKSGVVLLLLKSRKANNTNKHMFEMCQMYIYRVNYLFFV